MVLDLGSGGGIDVLLSARRVPLGGKAYGLDMTGEMLALAKKNGREPGTENAEFLKSEIGDVPLPDDHMDAIVSNRVVNLSPDKPKVISEAHRVLKRRCCPPRASSSGAGWRTNCADTGSRSSPTRK